MSTPVLAGAHVSSGGGIYRAIERARALDADALQIFTQSPRAWRPTNHAQEALERFRTDRVGEGIEAVVCHALYLINLANPDPVIYEKSRTALTHTVEVASAIEADCVVFHVGSHLGHGLDVALPQIGDAITEALSRCEGPTWLLLENSAGAGGTIGRSVAELAAVIDYLDAPPQLGVCLDSCHLFVSGVDVGDTQELDKLVGELDELVCPRFCGAMFLDSGGLDDQFGGRLCRGRGIRRSFVGGRLIWSRLGSRWRRWRGCWRSVSSRSTRGAVRRGSIGASCPG